MSAGPVWAVREGPSGQSASPAQCLQGERICSLGAGVALWRTSADAEAATAVGTASGRTEHLPGTVAPGFQLSSRIVLTVPVWREVHGMGSKPVEAGQGTGRARGLFSEPRRDLYQAIARHVRDRQLPSLGVGLVTVSPRYWVRLGQASEPGTGRRYHPATPVPGAPPRCSGACLWLRGRPPP